MRLSGIGSKIVIVFVATFATLLVPDDVFAQCKAEAQNASAGGHSFLVEETLKGLIGDRVARPDPAEFDARKAFATDLVEKNGLPVDGKQSEYLEALGVDLLFVLEVQPAGSGDLNYRVTALRSSGSRTFYDRVPASADWQKNRLQKFVEEQTEACMSRVDETEVAESTTSPQATTPADTDARPECQSASDCGARQKCEAGVCLSHPSVAASESRQSERTAGVAGQTEADKTNTSTARDEPSVVKEKPASTPPPRKEKTLPDNQQKIYMAGVLRLGDNVVGTGVGVGSHWFGEHLMFGVGTELTYIVAANGDDQELIRLGQYIRPGVVLQRPKEDLSLQAHVSFYLTEIFASIYGNDAFFITGEVSAGLLMHIGSVYLSVDVIGGGSAASVRGLFGFSFL